MTHEFRDKFYGQTMSEVISRIPGELPIDAVGLWQIVPKGRDGFGLTGEALVDFIRKCIFALIDAGAVPVSTGKGTQFEWIAQRQYGRTKEEIAEIVIREWSQAPNDQDVLFKVWFARPDPAFPKYVMLD